MNDKVKDLYDFLTNEGYDFMGSEDEFRGKLQDGAKAGELYSFLTNEGYDFMGTYDEFISKVGAPYNTAAANRAAGVDEASNRAKQAQQAQQPTQRNMGTPGVVPNRFGIPMQQQGGMGPVADAAPHPMTPAQMQGQQYVTQQGQGETYTPSARVQTPTAKRPKPMAPKPVSGDWNGESLTKVPYAPTTEEDKVVSFMPIEQGEDTKARYDAQRNAVGGQGGQVETMRSDIDSRLQEAYQRDLDNYGSELDKGGFWARMGRSVQAAEGNNPAANAVPSQLSDDTRDYQAAKHALDNSQKIIDEANAASRNGNFFAGAGRGMRDKFFDVSTWDFGITDLTDQAAIMRALEAYDKGEQLTESQQALLDAKAVELATTAYFGSELGRGYKAGQVTAEAIPFMFEMAINPAAGIGKGASKAMVRYALKKFGKEAIEKGGKRYIAKQAMKYGTRIVGDVVGASGMTATTGAARTAADALDRMAGNLHYDTDAQGNITFDGHTDAESWVKAFGKAFASTTIENYSEMLGNYFGPALGLLGKGASKVSKGIARTKAGAAVGRGIDKIGGAIETAYNSTLSKKIGLQAVGDFISKVPTGKVAGFLSELEKRAQWHGVMGEYAEEVAGGILNALVVGDQTLDTDKDTGVFNLDNNIDTFLGVALMGGFFSGARTVGYGAERAHNARQFNKANRMGAAAFGDGWANVQAAIESDPKAGAVAVLADPNSTKEQREAALRYAAAVTARQGMEQGKAKRDAEGIQTQQEAAAEQSYNTGYDDANTDELRSDINMAYTDARAKLVELIGDDAVNDIDSDPLAMQAQYDQDMTVDDNTKSAIADYVSAKSAWDGVQQRISDDAADRADQRRAEGEKMAYKGKGDMQGAIRPLTIKEESSEIDPQTGERKNKTVYLVNGNIAIEPNGNGLSREGTDKTIYVYDPETGEAHELDPFCGAGVLSVGDVVSMEDYLADNEQQSQAEVQQEIDNATGKVNVAPNTPFVTPEGRQGIVKSVEGDNVIVQFADGEMEEASIPLADMQQYADALRRQEYEARHPQQTAAEQPQQPNTATEGQAPTAQAETPTEGGNAVEDTRTPAQRTYDDVVAKLGADRASKKIDATEKVKADRLKKAEKALKTAQETADNTEYGSKEEQKAEEAVVKAQAEYEAAQQDMAAWDEVRKLRDKVLLAQSEQEEQQRKAELERKRAAETEAQRKQREEYEADQARRKAEAEAAEKRRQEENERLKQQAANPQPAEQPAPIEGTKGQASQLAIARQELADDPGALAMLEDMEPTSLEEVAAMLLTSGKGQVKLLRDDFMAHTGYSSEDVKRYPFIFAGKEKGGITLAQFGENVIEEARDYNIPFDDNDAMVGVNAVLNMLSSVGRQSDINDYVAMNRIRMAYDYHNTALAAARANMLNAYGMTEGEYEAYMSWLEDAIEQGKSTLSDEEVNQIFNVYEQGQTTDVARGNQEGTETAERPEGAETDVSQNGERGNGKADAGTAEVNTDKTQTLAEIENFHKRTSRGKRTELDLNKYDEENSRMPLLLDGKGSNISISAVLPTDINQPIIYRANYTFGDFEQMGEYIDEWNKTHKTPNTKAREDADTPECYFTNVDAAVAFADWVKKQEATHAAEQTEGTAEGEKPTPTKETPKQEPKLTDKEQATLDKFNTLIKRAGEIKAEVGQLIGEPTQENYDKATDEVKAKVDALLGEYRGLFSELPKDDLLTLKQKVWAMLGSAQEQYRQNESKENGNQLNRWANLDTEINKALRDHYGDNNLYMGEMVVPFKGEHGETWDEHVNKVMEAYDKEYAAIEKSDGERLRKEAAGYSDERLLNTYIRNAGISQIFGKGREGIRKFIGEEKNFKAEKLDDVKENNLEAAPDAARQSFVQDVLRAELDRRGIEYKEDYTFAETSEANDWYKKNVEGKTEKPRADVGEKEEQSGKAVSSVLESTEKIEDFGEKIGMARKDTATKGIKRGVGEMPAWKKKYRRENVTPEELQALQSGKLSFSQLLSSPAHMVQTAFDPTKPFVGFYVEEPKTRWGSIRYYPIKDAERNIVAFNTEAEYEAALPVFEVRDQGYRVVEKDGKYKIVRRASNGKQVEYAEFDTREDAEAYMVTPEGATSLLNRKRENFELPALESLTRNGMKDWRKGRNITSDDMLQTFGFRGGEFGNWLNAEERQQFLNTAYDALMDLAEALGVSPRALSLGGALSIAFGARGRQGARAHYEPSRAVINLTKMKGAGSLAHEWAHALDNYFGMLKAGKEREHGGENDKWVTSQEWARNSQIRKEIDAIFSEIVQAMKHKTVTRQIDIDKAQADVDKKRASFEREVKAARANYERGVTKYVYNRKTKQREQQTIKPTEQQLAEFDRIMSEVTQNPQWEWDEKKQGFRLGGELGKQFYELVHDVMPNTKGAYGPAHNAFYFADKLAKAEAYLEKAKQGESETVRIKTDFLEGAEEGDKGRAGSYYTKDLEMFARAFETYLAYKMAASGRSSDYLTYKKGEVFKSLFGFNPYPEGEELSALTTLFDKLFSTMQEYTDEQGNVMLYERADGKAAKVSAKERKLRDAIVDLLRKAGIDVVTESEEGQRVLDMENGRERQHRVYHGSGADFEAFDHSHMGEGEGQSMSGYGTYVTTSEGTGRYYAKVSAEKKRKVIQKGGYTLNGEIVRDYDLVRAYDKLQKHNGNVDEAIAECEEKIKRWESSDNPFSAIKGNSLQGVLDYLRQEKEKPGTIGYQEEIVEEPNKVLYTVEIPNDTGNNYLDLEGVVSKKQREEVKRTFLKAIEDSEDSEYWKNNSDVIEDEWKHNVETGHPTWDAIRSTMEQVLEAKAVSEMFSNMGYVGYKTKGSDGTTYVIFNESDLQITDKVKFFRTESGEAYGFTMGGKIYLDPKIATAETPIHEYTHLWAAALRAANPKAWERLKSELEKDKDLMAYVQRLYPELKGDELMDEVFAHFSGRRGAERLRAEQERMEGETRSIVGKAKVIAMFENLRDALKKFWNAARELFAGKGVKNESAEDFADMVLADLVNGVKPDRGDRLDRSDIERDAEYLEAVESGDMEKAQRMVNEAAKRAMPDTKVVDENGNPLVVYHGTKSEFNVFDTGKREKNYVSRLSKGFYFTPRKDVSEFYKGKTGTIKAVFLNMRNPLIVNSVKDYREKLQSFQNGMSVVEKDRFNSLDESEQLQQMGYDGVYEIADYGEIVAFNPSQIKSADPVTYDDNGNVIPLSQRFNERNADIRYQRGATDSDVRFRGEEDIDRYINNSIQLEDIAGKEIVGYRYGEAPEGGRSYNTATNEYEKGVSMASVGYLQETKSFAVDAYDSDNIHYYKGKISDETGGDGEILLNDVQEISKEEYEKSLHEYNNTSIDLANALYNLTKKVAENGWRVDLNRAKSKRDAVIRRSTDSGVRFRGEEEPVFYSNAMRAVENIKQERATPEQWVKMIEKQGGMKAGEDKWLGLSEWLKGSDAKTLTKGEVLDYIRANEIQVEEVEYSEDAVNPNRYFIDLANGDNEWTSLMESEVNKRYGWDSEDAWVVDYMPYEWFRFNVDNADEKLHLALKTNAKAKLVDESSYDLDDEEERELFISDIETELMHDMDSWSMEEDESENLINSTRLSYTTEGLDNKREIVLTVPTIEPWNEHDEVHFGEAGGGRAVAWVRFGETVDADGKRVLVIDEIQSKRHQEGREKGYKKDGAQDAVTKANIKRIEAQSSYDLYVSKLAKKYNCERADIYSYANDAEIAQVEERKKAVENAEEAYEKAYQENNGVPDAPFEKNWHEVAMKRMLRYAAENGYDKVAWTKGEQQAERYDLGGLIDHIDIYPHVDNITGERVEGEYEVFPVDKRGNTMMEMTEHPFSGNLTADEVLQYYGKDLGTRMMQAADKAGKDEKSTIDGDGLRIGGEGMKGFYDQILPRFMDKYGKKWGVKTGEVELPNIGDNGLTMWSVDVTDDMRESVMRGQPLFRKSTELFEQYPTWLSGQTTSTGQHTTQITSTVKTYQRIGDWMQSQGMEGAKVLDASSGLGAGTQALRDMGFDVEDVEPYPSENRETPTYTRYEDVNGKYDVVISNAVLNVIPDDWRADVLRSMADKVKEGGKLIINVRDAKSIESQKQKIELDSPSEILVTDSKGNIRAYQKGFTKSELKAYVESELGEGWQVEIANEGNSGVKSGTAVVVTRGEGAEVPNYRKPADMMREGGEEAFAGEWYDRGSVERIGEFVGYSPKQIAAMNARQEESARKQFRDAAEKLHLSDNITFADSIDDVQGLTDEQRKDWRRKKGWYSPRTGKIVIILGNHKSMDDVMKSILHEGVAHHGLRLMFGEHFNTFLDNVYRVASPEIRDRINTMAKKHGWNFREATEEYLAMLAEDTDFERPENQSWWKQVKAWFFDMLHKIGFKLNDAYDTITDNELRYILWRSYENLVNPGRYNSVVEEAKDIAKQYDLKVGEFGTNTTKTSWNFGINNQKARERFVEMLDNSGVKYSHHYSSKYGSDYYTFSIRDRNGEIDDFRIRISDHAKPAQWGTSYIEGDNDFRSYEDAYRYLATRFDLSDKREAIERKMEELMQQVEEVQRNGETFYKMRDGNSLFSSPDAAINNRMETEVIPTMTGQLVDDIYADSETHKRDAAYLAAVDSGDMDTAQRMVNEGSDDNVAADGVAEDAAEYAKETERIEQEARANGTWMKAPNGKRSNLDKERWVMVRTKAFKRWFGDWQNDPDNASRVVDENGEPRVVYHGSRVGGFSVFADGEKQSNAPDSSYFFSSKESVAYSYSGSYQSPTYKREVDEDGYEDDEKYPSVYACFLNIREPVEEDFEGASWEGDVYDKVELRDDEDEIIYNPNGSRFFDSYEEAEEYAENNGYTGYEIYENPYIGYSVNGVAREAQNIGADGAIIYNIIDNGSYGSDEEGIDYVAFNPSQIKSADPMTYDDNGNVIPLSQRFNEGSDDIRFRDGEDEESDSEERESIEQLANDRSIGTSARFIAIAARNAQESHDNAEALAAALNFTSQNLAEIVKATKAQKKFDKATVKQVTDMARVMVSAGYLDSMGRADVKGLLKAIRESTGETDNTDNVNRIIDIMVKNQLKNQENTLATLLKIKGSRVDARGINVQGKLDPNGQQVIKSFKDNMKEQRETIESRIADAEERMTSEDKAIADAAYNEKVGLQLALDYVDKIGQSKADEKDIEAKKRAELSKVYDYTRVVDVDEQGNALFKKDGTERTHEVRHVRAEYKGKISDEKKAERERVEQTAAAMDDAIRHMRMERIDAYTDFIAQVAGNMKESMRKLEERREAEKRRIEEIHHNANSDMEGRPASEHRSDTGGVLNWINNTAGGTLFAPLASFGEMLRMFGRKSPNGEGYLFNRFMRGLIDARHKELNGVHDKYSELDKKAQAVFGGNVETWADMMNAVRKGENIIVEWFDGKEMKPHTLHQGNLMYIYMVNKMSDGRMKLRHMGIDDKAMAVIESKLDPRLKEIADWLQEDFLVRSRNEYNETHKRMFGASMSAIEDYFPLVINSGSRNKDAEKEDAAENNPNTITTATGAIKKRTVNVVDLDLLNADALHVVLDHIAEMEHWNAFAEYNRDLNTLRSYKRFENQVKNMTTILGDGEQTWKAFNKTAQIAVGSYQKAQSDLDAKSLEFASKVTAAKVAFRINTALKQLLSLPAYLPYANASGFYHALANDLGNGTAPWKWCMENLPMYRERWESRVSGDPRLLKLTNDWKSQRATRLQKISRAGMLPNAAVDALTVSIGAHAVYETRKAQYLKEGYSETAAEKRAIQDAEIAYNETQQSSEGGFVSVMQVDKSWLNVLFTIFRNASMAYQRQLHGALRNLINMRTKARREQAKEFLAKQIARDGVNEAQARLAAEQRFNRTMRKNWIAVATFGYIVQFAWNFGGQMWYLLFGDDDDKKKKTWKDILIHSLFGGVEGLTGGDWLSELGRQIATGDRNPQSLNKDMPLTSDMLTIIEKFGQGREWEAVSDIINLAVQAGVGANPQTLTDAVVATIDACNGDLGLAREAALFAMRVIQVPQSQTEQIYFDEIGMTGEEARKLSYEQLVERYAKYRVKRNYFWTPWEWDNEKALEKGEKRGERIIKERMETMSDEQLEEALSNLFESSGEKGKKLSFNQYAKREGLKGYDYSDVTKNDGAKYYMNIATWRDVAEDITLHQETKRLEDEIKRLKKLGVRENEAVYWQTDDRLKDLNEAKKEIGEIKKEMVDANGNPMSEEVINTKMENIRKARRRALYPEQAANPTDNVEE